MKIIIQYLGHEELGRVFMYSVCRIYNLIYQISGNQFKCGRRLLEYLYSRICFVNLEYLISFSVPLKLAPLSDPITDGGPRN